MIGAAVGQRTLRQASTGSVALTSRDGTVAVLLTWGRPPLGSGKPVQRVRPC